MNNQFLDKKKAINIYTGNGYGYYQRILTDLYKKDENTCYNVSSPFRSDRNPSFRVTRNPATNIWYFNDFGDSTCRGDVYDFAALYYHLSIEKDFAEILDRMFVDLELNKLPEDELTAALNWQLPWVSYEEAQTMLEAELEIGRQKYRYHSESGKPRSGAAVSKVQLHKKQYSDLSDNERSFLTTTGIDFEVMQQCKAFFIDGYTLIYADGQEDEHYNHQNRVWIAYQFPGGAKLYQPDPKRFWYVGKSPVNYCFGVSTVREFIKFERVFLVGGEKDVLTLMSRGYNAMCLNSETATITMAHVRWWYEKEYDVVVLYDNDDTGVKQAALVNERHGYSYVLLPTDNNVKDITDFFGNGGTNEQFDQLVAAALTGEEKQSVKIEDYDTARESTTARTFRSAKERLADAKKMPPIRPYAEGLLNNNEVVIFFGDTGLGKSILAIGLADAISKGQSYLGLRNEHGPVEVAYIDFELSDKQFEMRYSDEAGNLYDFSEKLFIDNINLAELDIKKYTSALVARIEEVIIESSARVLLVDNISFMATGPSEDSKVALELMKALLEIKKRMGISIVVLAHTPKKFGAGGITVADLAGSKLLSNFVDGVFAIATSKKDPHFRYIKQVKTRSGQLTYGADNVIVLELEKKGNFLGFTNIGFSREMEHYREFDDQTMEDAKKKAIEMSKQGITYREIGDQLGISKSTIGRWCKPSQG